MQTFQLPWNKHYTTIHQHYVNHAVSRAKILESSAPEVLVWFNQAIRKWGRGVCGQFADYLLLHCCFCQLSCWLKKKGLQRIIKGNVLSFRGSSLGGIRWIIGSRTAYNYQPVLTPRSSCRNGTLGLLWEGMRKMTGHRSIKPWIA